MFASIDVRLVLETMEYVTTNEEDTMLVVCASVAGDLPERIVSYVIYTSDGTGTENDSKRITLYDCKCYLPI